MQVRCRDLRQAQVPTIQFTERNFREFYERCRDVRETIEDAHRDWDDFQRRRQGKDS